MYGHHSECAVEICDNLFKSNDKYDMENSVTDGVESDVNHD